MADNELDMREKEITHTLQLVKAKGKSEAASQVQNTVTRPLEELSFSDVLRQCTRHKGLIAAAMFFVIACAAIGYALFGSSYVQETTSQFNNFENNGLFYIMDSLLPDVAGDAKRSDNKQEYASRAVSALTSNDFVQFLRDRAKVSPALATVLASEGIDPKSEYSPDEQDKFRNFFDNHVKITAPDGGGGILKLKNTGFFTTDFSGPTREYTEALTNETSRLMSEYLSKREIDDVQATRQVVKEKLELFNQELVGMVGQRDALINKFPPLSQVSYEGIVVELQKAKSALAGNKVVETRLAGLFDDVERRVKALNDGKIKDDATAEDLDKDLQRTLTHLKTVIRKNTPVEFEDATYQENASKDPGFDSKKMATYYIKQQQAFNEARVDSLQVALTELRDQVNSRSNNLSAIDDLTKRISEKQKLVESLDFAKVKLDFTDFKTLRRVEVFAGPIKFTSIMPIPAFAVLTLIMGLALGFMVSFAAERKNPSLTTVRAFEEFQIPVLGAIPSTKDFIVGQSLSFSQRDPKGMSYVRLAINLTNLLTYMHSKIALFTAAENPRQSATALYNLASYLSDTGRRVLIIEADFQNNYMLRLTNTNLDGGLGNLLGQTSLVDINPIKIGQNLELLTGSAATLPPVYRLASEPFLNLLDELKKEYDYIFIHTCPCLESPETADLSRYAGVAVLCADAKNIKVSTLERLVGETKLFLSKYSYFVLENAEDESSTYSRSASTPVALKVVPNSSESDLRKAG